MNLLPKTHSEFSQKEYWDSFFKKRGTKAFEWYGEYPELSEHLHKYIKQQDNILITGCGNSSLGKDLYDIGYKSITNIDISQVVIRQMLSQNEKERTGLKYLQMDALQTTFEDETFNVVLDKGTLDALMPDDSLETKTKIEKYFKEVSRVLKPTGRYLCISLLQEHILKALLDDFPENNFMFRVVRCNEAEAKAIENDENPMPVFLVICTKFKNLPRKILEIDFAGTMQRFESKEELSQAVEMVQRAAFITSSLKRSRIEGDEVSFDLYNSKDDKPRFTVYIVEAKFDSKNAQYAAFIVPQGRESEWLFSTKAGRQHLTKITKMNRLSIVTLHRNQTYTTLDELQSELDSAILNLAPAKLKHKKIPYLSLGSDVGKRAIIHEGTSPFSGSYVVEDVEIDGEWFRRLYYLSSQLVIQSEAKLRRKGVVDLTYLTCRHHVYMCAAARLATGAKGGDVVVVGLGGGGLCSFLNRFMPEVGVTAVEIDEAMREVARAWFGLKEGDKLKVVIEDGLNFLRKVKNEGKQFKAIMFDVDSKDSDVGMSCPPKEFLSEPVIDGVAAVINEGYFILNLVLRDPNLRPPILEKLTNKFKTVFSYKLAEDLNEIFICSLPNFDINKTKTQLREICRSINNFFKKNGHKDSDIDVTDLLSNLQIHK